jgi:hypothetical protein
MVKPFKNGFNDIIYTFQMVRSLKMERAHSDN